jgi:hypothetical protein
VAQGAGLSSNPSTEKKKEWMNQGRKTCLECKGRNGVLIDLCTNKAAGIGNVNYLLFQENWKQEYL